MIDISQSLVEALQMKGHRPEWKEAFHMNYEEWESNYLIKCIPGVAKMNCMQESDKQ